MNRKTRDAARLAMPAARHVFATTVLASLIAGAYAQTAAPANNAANTLDTVTVTGFRS